MEPLHSVGMQTHPCYTFYQRMCNCIKSEEFHTRMCLADIEDWYECKSRKKHRAFMNFTKSEMNKMKIYSLPTYNHENDTFTDGPLPKNADGYFSKDKELQTYYSEAS